MPALLQISEPQNNRRKRALGIDLGTTHSLVGLVQDNIPQVLYPENESALLPSIVRYSKNSTPKVGAVTSTDKMHATDVVLSSVKRLIGKDPADITTDYMPTADLLLDGKEISFNTPRGIVSATEVSAEILRALKQRACLAVNETIDNAVITVPAYFDNTQRAATVKAAQAAGLNVLRLLNEPTAAAISYGLDREVSNTLKDTALIAVYDFGGGTFDISILRLQKGLFSVLATAGDTALGGDDFDLALADYVLTEKLPSQSKRNDLSSKQWQQLKTCVREVREKLSSASKATMTFGDWQGVITIDELNKVIKPLIQKTLTVCARAVTDAGIAMDNLNSEMDAVVLVGGTTRTPLLRNIVEDFFGQKPRTDVDPDQAVVLGAAIQADLLSTSPDDALLLLDVVPLSLGIEVMGGLMEKVITRNTPIPACVSREFTTAKDGQTALALAVYQGERDLIKDCRFLGRFELRGMPPKVAGALRIEVTFTIDADGLLNVMATDNETGSQSHMVLEPGNGLDEKAISTMLTDAFDAAEEDKQARALNECLVEAENLLNSLSSALASDDVNLITKAERLQLETSITALRQAMTKQQSTTIRKAIEDLDKESAIFAQRRMDSAIKKVLVGRSVNE